MLDVGADGETGDGVEVVEVVFEVEFVEGEGGDKGGVIGRGEGGAQEGESEVRSDGCVLAFGTMVKFFDGVKGRMYK